MCLVLSHYIFNRIFRRGTDPAFDEIDLVGTHYEPYIDILMENISLMRGLEFRQLSMKGCDGANLVAYYFDQKSDKTAVICHGYRSHYFSNSTTAGRFFYDRGYNLLLIVSRGHEKSGGEYITFGELEHRDLLLWIKKAEEELGAKKLVLYGVSLGCNTVIRAAEHIKSKKVRALILDCGFINTKSIIRTQVNNSKKFSKIKPFIKFMCNVFIIPELRFWGRRHGFDIYAGDTRKAMAHSDIPSFFLHGEADKTVPVSDTTANFEACRVRKELFISEDAGHGAGFPAGGERLKEKLDKFLSEVM